MATLRDLIGQHLDLEQLDTGDLPDEVIRDTLDGLAGTLAEKVDAIVGLLKRWKANETAIDDEIKRLRARKVMFENRGERLRDYLIYNLSRLNEPRVETELYTVAVRAGKDRVVIDDESALPASLVRIKTEPDKAAIMTALQTSAPALAKAAHLERGPDYLEIR